MADVMRWRYGETNPIVLPVDAATVIEIGDLVYLDTDDAKPAAAQADEESEAANQQAFHEKFAGVAMQRSRAGDVEPIRIATTGVFELACASAIAPACCPAPASSRTRSAESALEALRVSRGTGDFFLVVAGMAVGGVVWFVMDPNQRAPPPSPGRSSRVGGVAGVSLGAKSTGGLRRLARAARCLH